MPSVIKVDQIQSDTGTVNLTSNVAFSGSASTMQIGNALYLANTNNFALEFQPDVAGRFRIASSVSSFGDNNPFLIERPSSSGIQNDAITIRSGGVVDLGKGQLKFPASQNASSDPNTLDDYEEGTWSPRITDNTNSSGAGLGHYRKIGNLVIAQLQFYNADISSITAGNALYISGLPYAQGSSGASHQLLSTPSNTLYGSVLAHDMSGTTTAQLYYSGGTDRVNWSTLTRSAWGGSSVSLYGTYIYRTAN